MGIERAEANGLRVLHREGRLYASSVMGVEDPGGAMIVQLKKKGYKLTQIYNFCPEFPSRCQSGWQLSMTPYHLRKLKTRKGETTSPLDQMMADLDIVCKKNRASSKVKWTLKILGPNSFLANLIFGNLDVIICTLLTRQGFW